MTRIQSINNNPEIDMNYYRDLGKFSINDDDDEDLNCEDCGERIDNCTCPYEGLVFDDDTDEMVE